MTDPPPPAFGGGRYLIDNSAWARLGDPRVADVAEALIENLQLLACDAFILEALHSARDSAELDLLTNRLATAFEHLEITPETWALARSGQGELARVSAGRQRRFSTSDLILAALAHQHSVGVLHLDADFDSIGDETSLRFESQWLAEPSVFDPPPPPAPRKQRNNAIRHRLALFPTEESAQVAQIEVCALLDRHLAGQGIQLPAPAS